MERNDNEMKRFKQIQKDHLEQQLRAKNIKITNEEMESLLEGNVDVELFTDNVNCIIFVNQN